jgi:hypothetical protein
MEQSSSCSSSSFFIVLALVLTLILVLVLLLQILSKDIDVINGAGKPERMRLLNILMQV